MKNRIYLIGIFMLLNASIARAADFRENFFTFLAVIMVVMVILLMFEDGIGAYIFKITDRVIDSIHRLFDKQNTGDAPINPVWPASFVWFTGAFILGFVSLHFLPVSPVIPLYLRIADLVLAPIAVALISKMIANYWVTTKPSIIPRNVFWQAFWASLGFVLVRFAFAS
ncbi:hypothetical protein [Methyloradius palustris]|uniref:Uncharacterized protein n=1 Tax=Methyloradius palustris TaxID=2778876 RepID=A0A8D5FYM0_9PROT|nr:hypothetical protein [Methyloradius palustris]BCM24452.1 hypothetical protein ZMTM_07110 [Methyloradius palustris]